AVAVAERLVALDPLREDWQRIALTLYARYRGKSEALAQADVFAATLQRELGVAPEKETRDLLERIRCGDIAIAASTPTKHAAAGSADNPKVSISLPAFSTQFPTPATTVPHDRTAPHLKRWAPYVIAAGLA